MKEINIFGDNRYKEFTKIRIACRGICFSNNKIVLSLLKKYNMYMIPGGGLEQNETLEECVEREVEEETGYIVKAKDCFLVINEYYEEYKYISYYFLCDVINDYGNISLTDEESDLDLSCNLLDLDEIINIFRKHNDYKDFELKRGIYLREYNALLEYKEYLTKIISKS